MAVLLTPDPISIPPQEPVYQYQLEPVPKDPPFLLINVVEPIHIVLGFIDTESAVTEFVFIVIMVLLHAVVLHELWART